MSRCAPSGAVNVYQGVVEVIPNVAGEVVDVPVEGLKPLTEGDVLFRIDPVPYQATVDQLKAQLADTEQNVERLRASADAANATGCCPAVPEGTACTFDYVPQTCDNGCTYDNTCLAEAAGATGCSETCSVPDGTVACTLDYAPGESC